jgi:hypothetical protein
MRPVLGDDDEVGMGNAEPVDYEAHAVRSEDLSHASPNTLCDDHNVRRHPIAYIGEVVNVSFGNHEALASCGGVNGHECEDICILVDHTGRRIACNDLAKWTAHAFQADRKTAAA